MMTEQQSKEEEPLELQTKNVIGEQPSDEANLEPLEGAEEIPGDFTNVVCAAETELKYDSDGTVRMKRQIGLLESIAFIVGTIIGSGIFITPSKILEKTDSVATSLIVWVACGFISILAALSYCELGTVIQRSGGEHAYLLDTFKPLHRFWGELPAFLYAWLNVTLLKPSALAINSLAFGDYTLKPILQYMGAESYINSEEYNWAKVCIASAVVLLLGFVNIYSVKAATRAQVIFTAAKLLAMGIIIGIGVYNTGRGSFGAIPMTYDVGKSSYGDIAIAFYSGLWSYAGWNTLNYMTEELIDPAKNLPRAIIIGLSIVIAFYLMVNIAYLSALDKQTLIASKAVAVDVGNQVLGVLSWIIPCLIAASTFGTANCTQFAAGRVACVAARDGHLVDVMSYVHATRLTPTVAVITNTFLSLFMILYNDLNKMIAFYGFVSWIFYGLALASVIILRFTQRDAPRPIKIPLILPALGLIACLYLIVAPLINHPRYEYLYILAFAIVGFILYCIFVYKQMQLKCMVKFTQFIQCLTLAAPAPYKRD